MFTVRETDECEDDIQCPSFGQCRPNDLGILKCAGNYTFGIYNKLCTQAHARLYVTLFFYLTLFKVLQAVKKNYL